MSAAESVADVLSRCRATTRWAVGMCGQFCAVMYGYGASGYVDALTQWQRTPSALRHPGATDEPPGALLFWGGGSAGHGHVAIADGNGSCWSIDILGAGTVGLAPVRSISQLWGLPYLGWSEPYFQGQKWSPAMIYGLDIASFQSSVVPSRTPSDSKPVDFCLIKATQGTNYINPKMAQQATSARAQGMVVGFYHFLEKGNVNAQVDYFLRNAVSVDGDLLAVDWETDPDTNTYPSNAEKDAAIKRVQALRPMHRCLLYCNTSFWKNIDTTSFAGDGLWIATAGYAAGSPPVQSAWVMHQYSTAGSYDHDVAQFSSRAALRAWAEGGSDDVALTPEDKTWIKSMVESVVKDLVYDQVWGLDQMTPPAGQATTENPKWYPQSLLRYAGERGDDVLAQSRANGAALSAIAQTLAALDLSQLPEELRQQLADLKLVVTVEDTQP
jgi:hypothetical protein